MNVSNVVRLHRMLRAPHERIRYTDRFEEFAQDLVTWAMFRGPQDGESAGS